MIILVSGGAASGKSEYAEKLLLDYSGERIYLATMLSRTAEDVKRVARHRTMRMNKGFITVERPLDLLGWECPKDAGVLLECITNLLANELYEMNGAGKEAGKEIIAGILHIAENAGILVVVTGDVFADGILYDSSTMEYIDILGNINREIAVISKLVVEVICGIPDIIREII